MPASTPSYIKNRIRCSLFEIVDPSPSRKDMDRIWIFFNSRCAYCGKELNRALREGHIDHLVPSSVEGINHISNRVLACGICNGDEKRDSHWVEFIYQKCGENQAIAKQRIARIKEWKKLNPEIALKPEILKEIKKINDRMCLYYDRAVTEARKLKAAVDKRR